MASRRHHHHGCSRRQNQHDYISPIATSSRCFSPSPCCNQSTNHPPPPPDNLLHLLSSYLQNQPQESQYPDQTCSCQTPSPRFNGIRIQHQQKNVPREYDHIVLSCLLRKIDDLESSLNQFSSRYDQSRDRYSTLRDSAARVIQTHFRSFLVSRSISFRHLKELATIKSSFLSLKSSVLGKPHFPFKAVSMKATDLLLQLDSIQGRIDPMIRNSKRSLSRELVRFLQYIDDCAFKRFDLVSKSAINVSFVGRGKKPQGFGVVEDRTIEKLRSRIGKVFVTSGEDEDDSAELEDLDLMTDGEEDVPVIDKRKVGGSSRARIVAVVKGDELKKPTVKKRMVFDNKSRNVYQVYRDTHDLSSSAEEDDSVNGGEEIVMMSRNSGVRPSSKARNVVLVKGSGRKDKVGKTVSFDETGNIYKVYGDTTESSISEEDELTSGSSNGNGEEQEGNGNVVEEIKYVPKVNKDFEEEEEETQSENEVSSSEGSEGDGIVTRNANHAGNNEDTTDVKLQKGSLMISPPLPLKMEP